MQEYYNIETTVTYSGEVTICIPYEPAQSDSIRLLAYENNAWEDITTSYDVEYRLICGKSSLPGLFAAMSANTAIGDNITISLQYGIHVTFAHVSSAGATTARLVGGIPAPPTGFEMPDSQAYFEIKTTAEYSGAITTCIPYDQAKFRDVGTIHLLAYENNAWTDVTFSNDIAAHVICGQTDRLTEFGLFEVTDPITLIHRLIATIQSYNLKHGIENSLIVKLQNAGKTLGKGKENQAINVLNAFSHEVSAQSGKAITLAQAVKLDSDVREIISVIETK